jgi:hypothetical protein
MIEKTNETDGEPWHLPIKPIATPPNAVAMIGEAVGDATVGPTKSSASAHPSGQRASVSIVHLCCWLGSPLHSGHRYWRCLPAMDCER